MNEWGVMSGSPYGGYLANGGLWWVGLINLAIQGIFWILLITFGIYLYHYASAKSGRESRKPVEILHERYAKGEINEEEYRRRKEELK